MISMEQYKIRFISLGGVVGVTKNMYVYELYKGDTLTDILIVDCGVGFPHEKELGVDLVIPDISYLLDKTDKIRAVILTHGHEDHISALPFHYQDLGNPQVYTNKLTTAFIENKFREFKRTVHVTTIDYAKEYKLGNFSAKFIRVTHSIPDTMHVLIKTPIGSFYHGPDYKLDLTPPYGNYPDFYEITKAGHEGVLCLLSDSLGSEREGLTLSEAIVGQTFEDAMRKTKGKFIMTTFSSNISRIRQCVDAAIKFNRKIVFLGRSMRENTRLASEIGYLPIPQALFAKEEEVSRLPPNKVCMIVAGSQGQWGSALSKLANNQNKNAAIKAGDKVVFSSDPIPGNENEVNAVIEELSLRGAEVVYSAIHDQLHASGHGNQEDLKFLARFTNPKFFLPIGGTVRHQLQYQRLMVEMGYKKESVLLLDEGETMWFTPTPKRGEVIETKSIYVDAYGVGDVGNVVLRDRKTLSSEGMVVAVIIIDAHGKLTTRPKLVSRGFVFEGQEKLFERAAQLIEKITKPRADRIKDTSQVQRETAKNLENFFSDETGRKPLVMIEVIQV